MRIQFSLACQKGTIIPINYQSEISGWIFSALSKAGAELSAWVQQRGFDLASKNYKLFTFSSLAIYPYEMDQVKQEFKLLGNQVKLSVSLYMDPGFEQQVVHLFRQTPLVLGTCEGKPAQFEVKHWQVLPRPAFKEMMQFKAIAPISISSTDEAKMPNQYPLPDHETYDVSFFQHLIRKLKSAKQYKSLVALEMLDPSFPMHFRLVGQAKSRLIHLKPNPEGVTQLRGFVYDCEISLTPALMEFAFYSGFGEYGHLGFGFVELK